MWETIGKILTALGGASFIIYKFADFLGKRWAEKLNYKWKDKYDKELEQFRNELNSKRDILNSILQSTSSIFNSTLSKRVDAFQQLWKNLLLLRNNLHNSIFIYDIIIPKDFPMVFKNNKFESLIPTDSKSEIFDKIELKSNIEDLRPLIGEELWTNFFVYRAILGRLSYKLCDIREKRVMWNWNEIEPGVSDIHMYSLLEQIFNSEQIEIIKEMQIGAPKVILDIIEQKVLKIINSEITGSSISKFNFNQALEYSQLLNESEKDIPKNK